MVGSCISGLFVGFFGLKAFTIVGPGLASMPMFIDPEDAKNILYAFGGFGIAFIVSLVATMILYKESKEEVTEVEEIKEADNKIEVKDMTLVSPLEGEIIKIEDVNDSVFAGKILGDGIAIIPSKGVLKAPANGKVSMIADTKHSVGLTLDNGAEVLMHVGLDTVKLEGKHYDIKVSNGQKIKTGDVLLTFDMDEIKSNGYELTTPIIVVNGDKYSIEDRKIGQIKNEEELFKAVRLEA